MKPVTKKQSEMPLHDSALCPSSESNCSGCKICKIMLVGDIDDIYAADEYLQNHRMESEIVNIKIHCV